MDRSHAIDRSEAKFPMQCLSGSSSRIVTRRGEERRGIDGQLVDEIHTHTYLGCHPQYRQVHYLTVLLIAVAEQ